MQFDVSVYHGGKVNNYECDSWEEATLLGCALNAYTKNSVEICEKTFPVAVVEEGRLRNR